MNDYIKTAAFACNFISENKYISFFFHNIIYLYVLWANKSNDTIIFYKGVLKC